MCKESPALKQNMNLNEISIRSAMVCFPLLPSATHDVNCCSIDRAAELKQHSKCVTSTCGNKPNSLDQSFINKKWITVLRCNVLYTYNLWKSAITSKKIQTNLSKTTMHHRHLQNKHIHSCITLSRRASFIKWHFLLHVIHKFVFAKKYTLRPKTTTNWQLHVTNHQKLFYSVSLYI